MERFATRYVYGIPLQILRAKWVNSVRILLFFGCALSDFLFRLALGFAFLVPTVKITFGQLFCIRSFLGFPLTLPDSFAADRLSHSGLFDVSRRARQATA
jgi:hypothetical protein